MAHYLDTSAAVKLVVSEPGSKALRRWVQHARQPIVSCDLLRTELLRATKQGAPHRMVEARAVLDSVVLTTVPTSIFERAAEFGPDGLRSLDSIHLAAALDLGDDLDSVVTYDERMGDAARALGIAVTAPR